MSLVLPVQDLLDMKVTNKEFNYAVVHITRPSSNLQFQIFLVPMNVSEQSILPVEFLQYPLLFCVVACMISISGM